MLKEAAGACAGNEIGVRQSAGVHARDLRPARQAADRVRQRPIDAGAVGEVTHGADRRHVALAVVCKWARVCRAHNRVANRRTDMIACATVIRPHRQQRASTLGPRSLPYSSTARSRPRSSSHRLHERVNVRSVGRKCGIATLSATLCLACNAGRSCAYQRPQHVIRALTRCVGCSQGEEGSFGSSGGGRNGFMVRMFACVHMCTRETALRVREYSVHAEAGVSMRHLEGAVWVRQVV